MKNYVSFQIRIRSSNPRYPDNLQWSWNSTFVNRAGNCSHAHWIEGYSDLNLYEQHRGGRTNCCGHLSYRKKSQLVTVNQVLNLLQDLRFQYRKALILLDANSSPAWHFSQFLTLHKFITTECLYFLGALFRNSTHFMKKGTCQNNGQSNPSRNRVLRSCLWLSASRELGKGHGEHRGAIIGNDFTCGYEEEWGCQFPCSIQHCRRRRPSKKFCLQLLCLSVG